MSGKKTTLRSRKPNFTVDGRLTEDEGDTIIDEPSNIMTDTILATSTTFAVTTAATTTSLRSGRTSKTFGQHAKTSKTVGRTCGRIIKSFNAIAPSCAVISATAPAKKKFVKAVEKSAVI